MTVPPLIPSCIVTVVVLRSPSPSLQPLPLSANVAPPEPSSPPFSPFPCRRFRRVSPKPSNLLRDNCASSSVYTNVLIPKAKTAERDKGFELPQAASPSRFKTLTGRVKRHPPETTPSAQLSLKDSATAANKLQNADLPDCGIGLSAADDANMQGEMDKEKRPPESADGASSLARPTTRKRRTRNGLEKFPTPPLRSRAKTAKLAETQAQTEETHGEKAAKDLSSVVCLIFTILLHAARRAMAAAPPLPNQTTAPFFPPLNQFPSPTH